MTGSMGDEKFADWKKSYTRKLLKGLETSK
jgi:hypothetical protein